MATVMVAVAEVLHLFELGGAMSGSTPAPDAPFSQPESAAQSADLAGQGVSTQPISSPRFWRRHFLTFLSITLTLACFAYVGIQSVAAHPDDQPQITGDGQAWTSQTGNVASSTDGTFDENGGVYTVVEGGGGCEDHYTFAEAKHTRLGAYASITPTSVGAGVLNSVGHVEFKDVDELKTVAYLNGGGPESLVKTVMSNFPSESEIDVEVKYGTSKDTWVWDTTGTCIECIGPDQEGYAEYLVKCRTEVEVNLSWDMNDDAPNGNDEVEFKFVVAMRDHLGNETGIGSLGDPTTTMNVKRPKDVSGALTDFAGSKVIEESRDTFAFFVQKIRGPIRTGKADGLYKMNMKTTKAAGGTTTANFGTDKAQTAVVALWMVPFCQTNVDTDGQPANTTDIGVFPGGATSWANAFPDDGTPEDPTLFNLLNILRDRHSSGQNEECVSVLPPLSSENPGGAPPVRTGTRTLGTGELSDPQSTGTESVELFSDGSFVYTTSTSSPNHCEVCKIVYDNCGHFLYKCCKGQRKDSEGDFQPFSDCPGSPPNQPAPCEVD